MSPLASLIVLFGLALPQVSAVTERVLSQRWRGELELRDGQRAEMEIVLPVGAEAGFDGPIEFIELESAAAASPKMDPESLPPSSLQCYCDFKKKAVDVFAEKPLESQFNNEGYNNSFPKNKPSGRASFVEVREDTATAPPPPSRSSSRAAQGDRKRTMRFRQATLK